MNKTEFAFLYFKEVGSPVYNDDSKGREAARKNFSLQKHYDTGALDKALEKYIALLKDEVEALKEKSKNSA